MACSQIQKRHFRILIWIPIDFSDLSKSFLCRMLLISNHGFCVKIYFPGKCPLFFEWLCEFHRWPKITGLCVLGVFSSNNQVLLQCLREFWWNQLGFTPIRVHNPSFLTYIHLHNRNIILSLSFWTYTRPFFLSADLHTARDTFFDDNFSGCKIVCILLKNLFISVHHHYLFHK